MSFEYPPPLTASLDREGPGALLLAPAARAVALATAPARAGVHRARVGGFRAFDDRSGLDEQRLALEQTLRDDRMRVGKDSGERLPRDSHALCGRILVESLAIGQSNGLELVEANDGAFDAACRPANRSKSPTVEAAADTPRHEWSGHEIVVSICSHCSSVKVPRQAPDSASSTVEQWTHRPCRRNAATRDRAAVETSAEARLARLEDNNRWHHQRNRCARSWSTAP
jgi:hypothetical protein